MADTMVCLGCGSTWTDEQLAARKRADHRILSCCPERKMFNFDKMYAALTEIAKEQSALTGQAMADRFQKIARDALVRHN